MDTIRELLGRLGLAVTPHEVTADEAGTVAGPPAQGLGVRVDLASRYEVTTIVRSGRTEVRRTIPRDASPAIVREEIGEAVRSAIEAELLADEMPATPPPPALAIPPAPVAPVIVDEHPSPERAHDFALDIMTIAGAGPVATGSGLVPHVGGGLVFASRRTWRPSVSLTAEYLVPFDTPLDTAFDMVTSHASLVSLRALPAIELLHRSWVAIDVGAGGGVDIISVEPRTPPMSPTVMAVADIATRADPVLTARATAYVGLTPGVSLTVIAGLDVDLASLHYVVDVDGVPGGDVFVPWRVRPVLLAGFTFTTLGDGLFAARTP